MTTPTLEELDEKIKELEKAIHRFDKFEQKFNKMANLRVSQTINGRVGIRNILNGPKE